MPMICSSVKRLFLIRLLLRWGRLYIKSREPAGGRSLTFATLLATLIVLLILLARVAFLLTTLLPATLLGPAGILLVLLTRILALSALLVAHLIVLVLICHFRILSCRNGTSSKPAPLYGGSLRDFPPINTGN
ncbi:hypothetical protein BV98_002721 [Sphingobium herbicidovorans NBRC 16415]|uniref:Uncharacterized protein n=3 Tax=Sphingobium herbicidovorans TaxID=76947 RepID=A0A086P7T9_SPHHM|nr:hypothetical protein BV98_002721 [Sphingobium herbicidovorans NBRC 16415]